MLTQHEDLADEVLAEIEAASIIGDATKVIGAMMGAVNKALANAAQQQLAQTINLVGEVAATPPNLPGL